MTAYLAPDALATIRAIALAHLPADCTCWFDNDCLEICDWHRIADLTDLTVDAAELPW